jgi:hypothetical protein
MHVLHGFTMNINCMEDGWPTVGADWIDFVPDSTLPWQPEANNYLGQFLQIFFEVRAVIGVIKCTQHYVFSRMLLPI